MEIFFIPFEGRFLIYRPLRPLSFIGNGTLVRYIRSRMAGEPISLNGEVEAYLNSIGFWEPDPPVAEPLLSAQTYRPTMAVLLMTSACNLRCTYCYARGGEDTSLRMPLPLAWKIIDTAWENAHLLGRESFSLAFHGGGEPTLNWEALEASVHHAREKDLPCHVSMASNGVWNGRQRSFILEHFHGLSISLDGVREVQDRQRPMADGRGSFDTVMKSIRALDQAAFPYGIRLTTTLDSQSLLSENIDFLCRETSCPIIQVEPCYSTERGIYADPTPEQAGDFVAAFLEAHQIAQDHGRTLYYSGVRPGIVSNCFCRSPEEALVATPEGDLVTCFEIHDRRHPLHSRFVIGRANPDSVLPDLQKLRSFAEERQRQRSACRDCFCYWHCAGDCMSRNLAAGSEGRGRCLVNRALTRELLLRNMVENG